MPIYEYEHLSRPCDLGAGIRAAPVHGRAAPWSAARTAAGRSAKACPASTSTPPRPTASCKDLGFTKLVRRDDGVYENVTARSGDSRYMVRGKPETVPEHQKNDHRLKCVHRALACAGSYVQL
ncbi:MAG: zinc ribbon domain-containing protein [Desulfosudis oleivorans]|nr:zinc ribbon domain-containing protein [Desulfosudis oleivorans]